jgi:hypothetical protein
MRLAEFAEFALAWRQQRPEATKEEFCDVVAQRFALTKAGALWVSKDLCIRANQSRSEAFTNTVVSVRKLLQYDDRPIVACLLFPGGLRLLLANTTFVTKVSHSSHGFRVEHPIGSILGTDIATQHAGIANEPCGFARLWALHEAADHAANLARIATATSLLDRPKMSWSPTSEQRDHMLAAPLLAQRVVGLAAYVRAAADLDSRVAARRDAILAAAANPNRKVRGTEIEQIVTAAIATHALADLQLEIDTVTIAVDVKSKRLDRASAPKGYDVAKFLRLLSAGDRLLAIYFVGVDFARGLLSTRLCSVFDRQVLAHSRVEMRWSRRGGLGTVQFHGDLSTIWAPSFREDIDVPSATAWIERLLAGADRAKEVN